MTATFAVNDVVRLYGKRGVYKIVRLNVADFTVDLWGGHNGRLSMRTVDSALLRAAHKGDVAPSGGLPAPARGGRR